MKAKVGIVQAINNGKFFVKDSSGNTTELKNGDTIYENDLVFSDGTSSSLAQITVALEGEDVIVLKDGVQQLFDSSLIASTFGDEEVVFTRKGIDALLDQAGDMTNVESDLRWASFDNYVDITEEETTAGEEEEDVIEEGSIGQFALRDGDLVDVISDLRKKSWAKTQTYKEVENSEHIEKISLSPLSGSPEIVAPTLRPVAPSPIETIIPPVEIPTPPVEIPVVDVLPTVSLSVDDVTVYESEGFLIFTVTIDQPTRENISFNYKTSQNTAESGKDYHNVEGNITIPAGSTSVQIKVPVIDDYVSDNGENMKITISNPIGNVVVSKPEGVGTILDNPPANNNPLDPNKPDSETGTYGEEDTVFVVITGDKTVNEGDKANYTVQIIDKDGNPVFVTKDTKVTVVYKNISTSNDDTEYKDGDYIKKDIIIKAGTSKSEIFDVETKDDYLADNGEKFKLEITQVETTNEFENIVIGDKNGNQKDITTTILDDSKPTNYNPENPNNPTPSYPDPNKPNDGKIEKNQEQVILKIVAVDETGNPIMDGNRYTFVNSVNEGSNAKYMVLAFEPNTTEFTTQTVLSPSLQAGTVTIKTADDTALTTGTKDDAKLDYESTQKTVTLGQVFEVKTLDDYISDNGEKYKVSIIDSSYTHPSTPIYENVKIDSNPVITTIYDNSNPNNGTPHNPNDPTNHNQESDKDIVLIKLFAANKDGNVIKDTNGNYVLANRFAEGTEAKYIAYAFKDGETVFNDNTRLQTQTGTVDIEFHNGTATGSQTGDNTDTTGNKDFNNTSKSNISLGVTFGTDIFKDDMPEGEEQYTVTIDSNSYKGDYESVKIDPNPVTTTIYDKVDTIYAIIEGDIIVNEGDTASYTVKFIDKYGNEVEVEADTKVKVKFNHNNTNPTQNEDTQYNNDDEFEITIKAGKSKSEPFTVQTNDDVYKDDGEKYKLTITEIENTHGYNTSNIGDKDGNKKDIVTEIKDNTNSGIETNVDPVKIVLVAVPSSTTKIADITDGDGKLIITNTNETPEGGNLYYMAVAVDNDGKPVSTQGGTVTVNYGTTTDNTDKDATAGTDYDNTTVVSTTLGTVFSVNAKDDYYTEGDENFTVKITDLTNSPYESPSIDTSKDTVTSTIKDNPAKVEQPDTGTGNDNPTDGNYGKDDTVYVKITETPSTVEGGDLVHTITLVDKNGDLVTVPAGQTVTVNLTYSANSGSFTESDLSTIVKFVTFNGGESSKNFTNTTKDDFTYEGDEVYNVTISSVTQSGAFENVVIGDKDGNYKSTTGTIKDGVTIYKDGAYIDPENAIVDEDKFDVTNPNTKISNKDGNASDGTNTYQGQYLNIIKPNTDNNYSLIFDGNPTVYKGDKDSGIAFDYGDSRGTSLQSGGVVIQYVVNENTITGYKGSGRAETDKVFDIVLNKDSSILSGSTTKDNYTYTQYKNIDHPVTGIVGTDSGIDDNITFEFGFKIKDQGQTSETVKFKVTVNDSLPKATNWEETVNEDGSVKIVISPENFLNGEIKIRVKNTDSFTTLAKDNTIRVLDPNDGNKEIGTLTNNGDGTVTFKPDADYSNYNAKPWFEYEVSDFDGDKSGAKVEINVKPVADTPTIYIKDISTTEDDGNTKEGTNQVSLELKTPYLSKDSDATSQTAPSGYTAKQNSNTTVTTPILTPSGDKNNGATGDNPERNGEITLTFTNGDKLTGAKIFNGSSEVANITTANQEIKVVIVSTSGGTDIDTTYHHSGTLPAKGGNVLYLTKSEYEALKIQHAEDNDTDIKINIKVTSYELDDNGKPLFEHDTYVDKNNTNLKSETTANMTVKINPVTDDIELAFVTATGGTISQTDRVNDTFTFSTPINEGSGAIDLKSILSNTSGALNGTGGTKGDLDGSEKRTYTISGIPEGTIVKIGSTEAVAGKDGKATLTFKDAENKELDPNFTMEFPKTFGGGVKATITLSAQDKGADAGDTAGAIRTETVYLNIDVKPVATVANVNTIQVSQAIGYEDSGRSKGNTENPSSNIDQPANGIPLKIKVSSDDTDGSEKANIKITNIPTDAVIYYDEAVVSQSPTGTITINNFDNSKSLVFIPPFNNDADYTLKVSVQFEDTVKYNDNSTKTETSAWSDPKDLSVIVKNVADAPVGTELKSDIKVNEDNEFNLKDIYSNTITSGNFKSSDDTEELTVKIKLKDGFTISNGSPYYIDNGEYVVKAQDIIDGKIKIIPPKDFSGNASFDLTYVTTEKAGENDSKTWNTQTVNLFVNPKADDVNTTNSTTMYEDIATKVDLTATLKDSGTTNGTETIDAVYVSKATIEAMITQGYTINVNGANINTKTLETITPEGKTNEQYYVLTHAEANQITVINTTEHKINGDFTLNVAYKVTDTNNAVSDTKIYGHTHTVTVKAVTDQPTLTLDTITTNTGSKTEINGTTVTIKSDSNADFTIPITTTSEDKDSSEKVQEIIISGVPKGVEVVGATYYGYSGSEHNGIWVIKNPTDKDLDSNGASQSIKFVVKAGADFESRPIIITTYTKDEATDGTKVESASQTITIEKSYTSTGPGTGNPPQFDLGTQVATIYEDNDNKDGTLNDDDIYNLGKSITVSNSGGGNAGNWAITITDFPEGTKVEGKNGVNIYTYEQGGKTHYVITGTTITGNVADINTALSNVIVTPPKDMNTGGDKNGQMTFSATISTSNDGTYYSGTPITDYKNDIIPVTDEMTIAINVADTNEDAATSLTITLSNPNDGSKTTLIGNSITIKIDETWKDLATGGVGTKGTLTDSSGKYNIVDNGDGTYTITPKNVADNFKVDTPIAGLVYTPATNRDGDVKFEVSVQNKEGNSVTLTSKGDTTIKVTPVIDMKPEVTVVTATGIEDEKIVGINLDNPVKLNVSTTISADSSEKFTNIVLDEVPNGFTVWYKDGENLVMATNIGKTGGADFDLTPNIDTDDLTHRNKWLVPVATSGAMPEIYINAPTNWAGDFDFKAQFTLKEQNLTTTEKIVVDVTGKITPVADGVTIDPTLTFGKAFEWIDLKLNANMKDVDGSETMSLELSGLGANAQFRVDGTDTLSSTQAVWDNATNKWTISGIKYDQINNIQFTNDKTVNNVGVKAWTVENDKNGIPLTGDNAYKSAEVTKDFKLDIKDVGGILSLEKDINLDFSKLDNSSLKGINEIDLGIAGENKIENLKLEDVLKLTNNSGELIIKGDNNDKVSLKNEAGKTWSKGSTTETIDGKTFDIYSNSGDSSVKVKVQEQIDQIL